MRGRAPSLDVSVTDLRAELATWIKRVQAGEEVVVTDRGTPVARFSPIESAGLIDRLTKAGVLSKPDSTDRPLTRSLPRVHAKGSVSELVSEQRR